MSKPVLRVKITLVDGRSVTLPALFDTGSFYTLLRQDRLPAGAAVLNYRKAEFFRGAGRGNRLRVVGSTEVIVTIGKRKIRDTALVSPDLTREMIVGAGAMQKWDITVRNRNGSTRVLVGHDMRDPDITEVD